MRASDFTKKSPLKLKTYQVRLRLPGAGYQQQMDTTVQARNPEMARRMLRTQYNNPNVIVGQPRELHTQ
jgi:hypothetical protein